MKRPIEPIVPSKPIPPMEFEYAGRKSLSMQYVTMQDIIDKVKDEGGCLDLDTISLEASSDDEYGECNLSIFVSFNKIQTRNPKHAEQLDKYQKEMVKYKKKLNQYKKDFKEFKEKLKEYEIWFYSEKLRKLKGET